MPSQNMLLLESMLKELSPINDYEKVDALISMMQEQRMPHSKEVELQVLYAIRKSKLQIYFKEQWQNPRPTPKVKEPKPLSKRQLLIKEMKKEIKAQSNSSLEVLSTMPDNESPQSTETQMKSMPSKEKSIKELRKEIKERAKEVLEKKVVVPDFILESKPRAYSSKVQKLKKPKKPIDPLAMIAEQEAIRGRNRDKRISTGHSSTGVPLPTDQAIREREEKLKHHREVYYTNKKYSEGESKRGSKKFFINICTDGQNKKY